MSGKRKILEDGAQITNSTFKLWTVVVIAITYGIVFVLLIVQYTETRFDRFTTDWPTVLVSGGILLFSGIATSLLASLVFSILYSKLTEKRQLEVIGEKLSETLEEIYYKHIPMEVFEPSDESNPNFIRSIEDGLVNSNTYRIKAVSGTYLNKWLSEKLIPERCPHLVMVLLLNPKKVDVFHPYIRGFSSRHDSTVQSIQDDIYSAVKNLYEHRNKTRIQIRVYDDSVFYRSEIFEHFALVSFYENHNHLTKFPTSYKYSRRTINYAAVSSDFEQTWSINSSCFVEFNSTSTEKDKVDFLEKIGYLSQENNVITNEGI